MNGKSRKMVEHLAVGEDVETCCMSEGLSGKRGTIVRFDRHKQRYTIELDDGELMSVRAGNIREVVSDSRSTPPLPVADARNHDGAFRSRGGSIIEDTFSLRNVLVCVVAVLGYKIIPMTADAIQYYYSIIDIGDIALPIAICFGVAAFFAWHFGTEGGSVTFQWTRVRDKTAQFQMWGILFFPIAIMHISGADISPHGSRSLLLMFFFVWQFGTRRGSQEFAWENVRERLVGINIWEAIHLVGVVQGAVVALNRMVQRRR